MKRNLFIAISLSIMILLLFLIIGHSTPKDLDEIADDNTLIKYKSKLSVW